MAKRQIKFRAFYKGQIVYNIDLAVIKGEHFFMAENTILLDVPLMQYIGLKDKNSVQIWEGDIVKTGSDKLMVIGWSERHASFVIDRDGWAFRHYFGEAFEGHECEVVGNIHQNADLLKSDGK